MDRDTCYEITQARKVVNDPRRHPADKIEALLDIYDLYTPFIDEPYYANQRDDVIDKIREVVRTSL